MLSDVSFNAGTGEVLGLIGPNGAGKTTVLECLAGLLPSDDGRIYLSRPSSDLSENRRNSFSAADEATLRGIDQPLKKGTENVPLPMNTWHTLEISVQATNLQASLDGKHLLDYTLAETISGHVGVWSKTDSVSYFDQYTVTK